MKQWEGFKGDKWRTSVDTRDFIQNNYTEYKGDDSFLEPIAPSTDKLWTKLQELFEIQHEKMAFMTWIAISQQLLRHMNLVT